MHTEVCRCIYIYIYIYICLQLNVKKLAPPMPASPIIYRYVYIFIYVCLFSILFISFFRILVRASRALGSLMTPNIGHYPAHMFKHVEFHIAHMNARV